MKINENIVLKEKNGIRYIQFKPLLDLNIKNAYTLKNDNLIFKKPGYGQKVNFDTYEKLCNVVEMNGKNVIIPQANHTNNVKNIDRKYTNEELEKIDGLITNKKDFVLATTNADCILYLLYDKEKKVIGNIHSGWKGSYKRIIENAIDEMQKNYDCNPENIIVCICPSIRKCCFEVDKDVRDMFYEKFLFIPNIDTYIEKNEEKNKFFIDTVGINNYLMEQKGIKKENIYDCDICSICNKEDIHSYRAEGKNFNLATAVISL